MFEIGLGMEGFPAPRAEVPVEEKTKLFAESGALYFFQGWRRTRIPDIDQGYADWLFSKSKRGKLQALAIRRGGGENAAAPHAAGVPGLEPSSFTRDLYLEVVLKQGDRRFAMFEKGGQRTGGDEFRYSRADGCGILKRMH